MGMKAKVLLIEGYVSSSNSLSSGLKRKGLEVLIAHSGESALDQAFAEKPNVVVLDASSLEVNAKKLCHSLQEEVEGVPIILIVKEERGKLQKEEIEANEVLVRPFTFRKLINRIKYLLQKEGDEVIEIGEIRLDLKNRCVRRGEEKEKLTPKQCKLLEMLMRNPGKVLTRKFLMKEVWDTDYMGDTRTLDVHIHWVREKIEDDTSSPLYLHTVRGVGYCFIPPEEE
jgi:DNA-binding response OmpR family regulator